MSEARMTRREMVAAGLGGAAALAGAAPTGSTSGRGVRAVVVGAGAFGGWTALHLLRSGAEVTLVDAWGPGNSRASSGGDTRVIRATYGPHRIYTEMVIRALDLWKAHQEATGEQLFFPTGALWMSSGGGQFTTESAPVLRSLGVAFAELGGDEVARRFPEISPDGITHALYEEGAGYLLARRGCQNVWRTFLAEGGAYRHAEAAAGEIGGGEMRDVPLAGGDRLEGDVYVFAGGPWLARLFPGFDPPLVAPTRQEILYFGAPAGRVDLTEEELPVWVEDGDSFFYGIPGSEFRGFKVADDARGEPFDPTGGDRTPSAEGIRRGREYMERRFPAMRGAPLLEARVCQYEQSSDGHLIVDTHPEADNVWIAGGGSGHGYKLGPALGEMLAGQILGEREKEPFFGLARFGA